MPGVSRVRGFVQRTQNTNGWTYYRERTSSRLATCLKVRTHTSIQTTCGNSCGVVEFTVDTGDGPKRFGDTRQYSPGEAVVTRCFPGEEIIGIQIRGPKSGASWHGSVTYSVDGGQTYQPAVCTGCALHTGTSTADMVVSGNAESSVDAGWAKTKCMRGRCVCNGSPRALACACHHPTWCGCLRS